jgi:hypothetical protein
MTDGLVSIVPVLLLVLAILSTRSFDVSRPSFVCQMFGSKKDFSLYTLNFYII